jgi:hypothetical protein
MRSFAYGFDLDRAAMKRHGARVIDADELA